MATLARAPSPSLSLAVALAALICLALAMLRPAPVWRATSTVLTMDVQGPGPQGSTMLSRGEAGEDTSPAQPSLLPTSKGRCLPPKSADWLSSIPNSDGKLYSQNGEDGILLAIFRNIGATDQFYVEFGTEDATECNTRFLREILGWSGLLMDGGHENAAINQHREFISPDNINALFAKYNVPHEFDLLSIDVDFEDFYIWKAIKPTYRPRVLVIEYNAFLPLNESITVDPQDPQRWTGTFYNGASARAMYTLGLKKGYSLVATDRRGVNLFFIRSDILTCQGVEPLPFERLANRATYSPHGEETNTSRKWLYLDDQLNVVKREWLRLSG